MKILDNLLYTESHEWVKVDGDFAFIGISDFAQHELGDIVFVEVDTVGETMSKGDTFGTIEA
ncbi:MAG: glycine cleavage system protein H, partial [Bacteroidota bacterium]